MTTVMTGKVTGRSLIPDELFVRLVDRITHDEWLDRSLAERIMDQALAFLGACATNNGEPLGPSRKVDVGWHTFVLYTRDYAEFCDRVAGRFLHHVPTDSDKISADEAEVIRSRTIAAIERAGYVVDPDLWPSAADCHQCHAGCTDSPKK